MAFMKDFLDESKGALGTIQGKRLWYSRLIATGAGSSGYYPSEALETSGPLAFPKGTHVHMDHQSMSDRYEYPANKTSTIIGVIASDPVFDTVDGVEGLYANVEFTEQAAPLVEQLAPYVGLSIHAKFVEDEEAGLREDGLRTVKAILPSPLNTVDLVTVPGAKGKLLEALESFRDIMDVDNDERTEETMKPEDIEALADALVPKLKDALVADATEDKGEETPETPDVSTVAEAIISSDLPKAARKNVYARVAAGETVEEAIKCEKEYANELLESLKSEGVFHTSEPSDKEYNYVPGVWSN